MAKHYNKERVNFLLTQEKTGPVVDELVFLNYGLLNTQLRKFYLEHDSDALSLGYEALYKAIMTYDASQNTVFSTYATVCIFNKLGSHVRSLKSSSNLELIYYEDVTGGLRIVDTLESPLKADSELLSRAGIAHIYNKFSECYSKLSNPVHKQIIKLWSGSEFSMTHERIAVTIGCTQTYVSRIIKEFKRSLKNKLEESK